MSDETTTALAEKVIEGEHYLALGVHEGIPDKDYRSAPGINRSYLDNVAISPALALWRKLHPDPPTDAMNLGQALHTLVLEPHLFEERFVRSEFAAFTTKEAKDWRAAQTKTILRSHSPSGDLARDPSEWDRALAMGHAVREHPIAGTLFKDDGPTELSIVWIDQYMPTRRRLCKGRLDKWCSGHQIIADLKKTRIAHAAMSEFARSVHTYRYDVQAAYYTDGAMQCGLRPRAFVFCVVEEDPPYQVACYTLPRVWLENGRRKYIRDLETLSECMESGDFQSYPSEVRELAMPKFAEYNPIS